MAYVSLYRKYRPQTFSEVVGQQHVTRSLTNAIREDRLHHAYLFAGPRGTGKTSTARILAKSINCAEGPTPEPCNACDQCVAITNGSSVDVIELDMASHGGVDDARELRDRAQFAPASARRKVYILDEVHMASTAAFNALLKLIEEPPGHVVFAMATTDPQKVLPTIMSRVQRLDLRRVGAADVAGRVRDLVSREGGSIDDAAVDLVVRAGDGSVRDTESVLEQVLAYADGQVTGADVAEVLGQTTFEHTAAAVDAALGGDLAGAFVKVQELLDDGTDLRQFTLDLVAHLRDLLVLVVAPGRHDLVDATADRLDGLVAQAARSDRDGLAFAMDEMATALEQMRQGPARLALELALARIATRPGAPRVTATPAAGDGTAATVEEADDDPPPATDEPDDGPDDDRPDDDRPGGDRVGADPVGADGAASDDSSPAVGTAADEHAPADGDDVDAPAAVDEPAVDDQAAVLEIDPGGSDETRADPRGEADSPADGDEGPGVEESDEPDAADAPGLEEVDDPEASDALSRSVATDDGADSVEADPVEADRGDAEVITTTTPDDADGPPSADDADRAADPDAESAADDVHDAGASGDGPDEDLTSPDEDPTGQGEATAGSGGADFAARAGARAARVARDGLPEVPADRPSGPEVVVDEPATRDETDDLESIRTRWDAILELVRADSKRSHAIFEPARLLQLRNGVLALGYGERYRSFHASNATKAEFGDVLRSAIEQATGVTVRLDVRVDGDGPPRPRPRPVDGGPDEAGAHSSGDTDTGAPTAGRSTAGRGEPAPDEPRRATPTPLANLDPAEAMDRAAAALVDRLGATELDPDEH